MLVPIFYFWKSVMTSLGIQGELLTTESHKVDFYLIVPALLVTSIFLQVLMERKVNPLRKVMDLAW